MGQIEDVLALLTAAPAQQREEATVAALRATAHLRWVPNAGKQCDAYWSLADETLYGGEAGGGKSDLLLGLALTQHQNSLILRRVKEDIEKVGGLGPRLVSILGSSGGYNTQKHVWNGGARQIELGGCEQEKDKERYKGRGHDLKAFDELADFLESQYVFIIGWLRSTIEGQRCRIVAATNPPTTPEGQWIVRRWAAWLDPHHPNPAKDGELRWYIEIDGKDTEVDGPGPHVIEGRRNPVKALSRTFIRSGLADNPDLARTDYEARLEGLPEELRRAYRGGDFTVGLQDDDFQTIPSAWVEAACARWTDTPPRKFAMTAIGVDVAQGGKDQTVIAPRYGGWYAPLFVVPGAETKEGRDVAGLVVKKRRGRCPVIIDVGGGYGADAVVALKDNGIIVVPFNGVLASTARSRDKQFKFRNKRAEAYWRFREALDPEQEGGSAVALPNDPLLKADLAAVHWQNTRNGILCEEKEKIKERLGRSPDRGDAVVMCLAEGERAVEREVRKTQQSGRSSSANLGYSGLKRGFGR